MKDMYIFIYGTLKKGFTNNNWIKHLEYIDEAKTCEKFQMYPCTNYAFPFVIKSQRNHEIFGEVYKLNSLKDLESLDKLEDYPYLYLREVIDIELVNGKILKAIIYLKNEDTNKEFIKLDEPILEWTEDIYFSSKDLITPSNPAEEGSKELVSASSS